MTYKLRGGEEVRDGKLYGWTGKQCARCRGHGADVSDEATGAYVACNGCGGTGEEWGLMPTQPADLPRALEQSSRTKEVTK